MVEGNVAHDHGKYEKRVKKFACNAKHYSFCHARQPADRPPERWARLITQIHVTLIDQQQNYALQDLPNKAPGIICA